MPRSGTRNAAAGESSIVDAVIWLIALGAIGATLWYSLGPEPPGHASDKDLHAVAYFVNTFAILLAVVWRPGREDRRPRDYSTPIAACVLAAGGLIEIAQGAFAGRDGQLTDWVADAAGVALALLTFTLLRRGWNAVSSI